MNLHTVLTKKNPHFGWNQFSSHIFSSRFYLSVLVCWALERSMGLHCKRKRFLWPFVGEWKSFSHTHRGHWHCIPYRPLYILSLAHLQSFEEHLDQSLFPRNSSWCQVLTPLCMIPRKILIPSSILYKVIKQSNKHRKNV